MPTNGDFIERHAKAVSKKHKVTILHIISDENCTQKIEIVSEKKDDLDIHIAYIKKTKSPLNKILLYRKAFLSLLKNIGAFDVVHLNKLYPFGIFSLYLKKTQKKPFIISEHFTGYHLPLSKNISFIEKFISKKIAKNAAFICPVSNNLKEAMQQLGFDGNYKRVPNVVDTNLFVPSESKNSVFTISHISNMINRHKNIEGLLQVIKKLETKLANFKVEIIGENSSKYISFANKIDINLSNVTFIDQIPHKEIANRLQNSDLFVLFSNYENLPCVILESFSCGVPVISTNVGGIKEYFPEDFGKLIKKNNQEELLKSILIFEKSFKTKTLNKQKMHNFVIDNFSENKIALEFEKLYFKALK
ncbi:hypothetical protein BXQ17_06575 [Polaribacter sp. BM10]|nr:hypothetical protein BXQ17_06575 [Polaribacter sp. BM10]